MTGTIRNLIRFVLAPIAMAGIMSVGALGFSAVADASTGVAAPTACTFTGSATQCQTPGNVQVDAEPGYPADQPYPYFGYGYGGFEGGWGGFHHHEHP